MKKKQEYQKFSSRVKSSNMVLIIEGSEVDFNIRVEDIEKYKTLEEESLSLCDHENIKHVSADRSYVYVGQREMAVLAPGL